MKSILLFLSVLFVQFAFSTPVGDSEQLFCIENNPTIQDIQVTGNNILWFATDDNTQTPLDINTPLVDNTTYYAFDSTDANAVSLAVTVFLMEIIPAPVLPEFTDPLCNMNNTVFILADAPVMNTDAFTTIYWYDSPDQTTGNQLPYSTPMVNGQTYYAFQAVCNCQSNSCVEYLAYTFEVYEPVPAPIGDLTVDLTENSTLNDIPVFNTTGYTSIYWNDQNDATFIIDPNTVVVNGQTYYAFQSLGSCVNLLPVTVNIINLNVPDYENSPFKLKTNLIKDYLEIDINGENKRIFSVEIFTVTGSIVFKKTYSQSDAVTENIANLKKGVYFLRFKSVSGIYTEQFLKI